MTKTTVSYSLKQKAEKLQIIVYVEVCTQKHE